MEIAGNISLPENPWRKLFWVKMAVFRILGIQYLVTYIDVDIYWHNLYFICIFIINLILKSIHCLFLRLLCCYFSYWKALWGSCLWTALETDQRRSDSNKLLHLSNLHVRPGFLLKSFHKPHLCYLKNWISHKILHKNLINEKNIKLKKLWQ